ncbi:hypothetical protein K474DRAFT_1659278 [Panus rudis PR-1116 ss-1]|nr:hypothetical protein K474DRAFT_1659278 [Panus rudis PR-1116 ss-1]
MVSFPPRVLSRNWWSRTGHYIRAHLNFFRIHLLFFTFTPLIFSGILYACNGKYPLSYIDALFNCVSAITVCGLATVDLSSLTPLQQVLLFVQMCIGNPVIVSWVMVYIRREFFKAKFTHIVQNELSNRVSSKVEAPVHVKIVPWWKKLLYMLTGRSPTAQRDVIHEKRPGSATPPRVRPDMIRRMDDAPKLVNPSGWISEGHQPTPGPTIVVDRPPTTARFSFQQSPHQVTSPTNTPSNGEFTSVLSHEMESALDDELTRLRRLEQQREQQRDGDDRDHRRLSDVSGLTSSSIEDHASPNQRRRMQRMPTLPRTQTVEFAPEPRRRPMSLERGRADRLPSINDLYALHMHDRVPTQGTSGRRSMSRPTMSIPHTTTSRATVKRRTKHRGFGGFPMPHEIISKLFSRAFPKLERTLTRTVTIPRTQTIASQRDGQAPPGAKLVPYVSFDAVVGRNSKFHRLTREQLEELGGVEYRSLTALLWIVGGYHIILQAVAFTVIAPYMSLSKWRPAFEPPTLHRSLSPVWFSLFQVVSAYTNTGMSLEDQSMIPFQTAYPTIIFTIILILAGNTAFPIFLRFTIWVLSKVVRKGSRLHETLHFLLDHPRRCFVYLFPSHQTWFLLTVLIALTGTDWFFFLVLDIGTPAIEAVPVGLRFLLGLLQAAAVRAAGFASVPLAALAPAVKVLYVLMMYVSVYPIAMSVRSTNVYEEKSLGIFDDDESSIDEDEFNVNGGNRATVWSRYLAMHMRKQLSFDMWWLGLALFLLCIIERPGIDDTSTNDWFNIFTILFELVSAYGTVGLSLGVPYANYSFSGALRPLSKLIVCAVMLRGRHRGLPVAIDRAVMLPFEFRTHSSGSDDPTDVGNGPENFMDEQDEEETASSTGSESRPTPEDGSRERRPSYFSDGQGANGKLTQRSVTIEDHHPPMLQRTNTTDYV